MILFWWHWALIGFGFVMAELLFPAFVLLWFGLSGLGVMLALLALPELALTHQLALWTFGSLALTLLWFMAFRNKAHRSLTGQASAALIGEEGLITQHAAPFQPGKVRFQKPMIGSEIWECLSDVDVAVGTRVRVVRIEGNKVVVTPKEEI